ncbi:MAG: hypothetical protein KGQ93_01530 [Cyanobacteria bacterium REEB459]|nr:hypothetical protein [Cyanobacteria bacterium REEB459]
MVPTYPVRPDFSEDRAPWFKPLLAAALMLALTSLALQRDSLKRLIAKARPAPAENCQTVVRSDARLSREQLARLLTIPERNSKVEVQKILAEPYCRLPPIQLRAEVVAERDSYPLAFDPHTHLVVLYEKEEYAGYRFRFN